MNYKIKWLESQVEEEQRMMDMRVKKMEKDLGVDNENENPVPQNP